jgi:hypothetical protein
MDWTPTVPERWKGFFDEREHKHVAFCVDYERNYKHGAPGHLDMLVIAKLVDCLVDAQTNLIDLQRTIDGVKSVEHPE